MVARLGLVYLGRPTLEEHRKSRSLSQPEAQQTRQSWIKCTARLRRHYAPRNNRVGAPLKHHPHWQAKHSS
jgi:hypothetical protein